MVRILAGSAPNAQPAPQTGILGLRLTPLTQVTAQISSTTFEAQLDLWLIRRDQR